MGHYEILASLGRGSMGLVLRAFDEKLRRTVAIKVLAPSLAASDAARRRFAREARSAAGISHDHVVGVHGVEDGGPVPFLVMQLIDGPTLQQKLDTEDSLPLSETVRIGFEIASGLAAAHARGLTHRDVKPSNILIESASGRAKLSDFGLACGGDDSTITNRGLLAGTPSYMSPKQASGDQVDFRSDLFSLGSVLYAMASGGPPFRGSTPFTILNRVGEEVPKPLREVNPAVPRWFSDLVARLHAKEPTERPASAQEVADLFAAHLAESPSDSKWTLAVPPRWRHRFALAPAVLLAAFKLSEATGLTRVRDNLRGGHAVIDACGGDVDRQQQAQLVVEELPLAALDLLGPFGGLGALRRLAVAADGIGRRLFPSLSLPSLHDQGGVKVVAGAVVAPLVEVIVVGRPGDAEVAGQHWPLAAATVEVENGVDDRAEAARPRCPGRDERRQERLHPATLGIGQVGEESVATTDSERERGNDPHNPTCLLLLDLYPVHENNKQALIFNYWMSKSLPNNAEVQ